MHSICSEYHKWMGEDGKRRLAWEDIDLLVDRLVDQLPGPYDRLLVVTRGGMIPAALVSRALNIRDILVAAVMFYDGPDSHIGEPLFLQFPEDTLVAGKNILVIDDVWDSGRTSVAILDKLQQAGAFPTVAVLHYKPLRTAYPDRLPNCFAEETNEWIVYPWEREP